MNDFFGVYKGFIFFSFQTFIDFVDQTLIVDLFVKIVMEFLHFEHRYNWPIPSIIGTGIGNSLEVKVHTNSLNAIMLQPEFVSDFSDLVDSVALSLDEFKVGVIAFRSGKQEVPENNQRLDGDYECQECHFLIIDDAEHAHDNDEGW